MLPPTPKQNEPTRTLGASTLRRWKALRVAAVRGLQMDTPIPVWRANGCEIVETEGYLRAFVAAFPAQTVQECYRVLFHALVERRSRAVLVIGSSKWDPFYHLAARDALRSIALAGLPSGFRIAFVADTPDLIAVYDAAVVQAQRLGIEAKRFLDEREAVRWLTQ